MPSASLERLELLLHRSSGMGGHLVRKPFRRRVRAMGGGERVVHIDVAELGERVDMGGIVLLLALMEARVLEQKHVAVLHFRDRVLGRLADAVGREGDRPLDDVGDRGGDGPQRIGLVRAALGPAEMGEQNDLAALVGDFRDRRRDAFDARRIGHPAVLGRNVEIDAQEHALAGHVCVVEGAERLCSWDLTSPMARRSGSRRSVTPAGVQSRVQAELSRHGSPAFAGVTPNPQISFAIATAVSAMRFEKPHSLSYQESTRTKLPSITLVWSRWKIEERSSPLKSLETLGSSV